MIDPSSILTPPGKMLMARANQPDKSKRYFRSSPTLDPVMKIRQTPVSIGQIARVATIIKQREVEATTSEI